MSDARAAIWADDKLSRRSEADVLESFLLKEVARQKKLGRNHAFVLAIDAAYGEGKTWFLERFTEQLRLNHPVAVIDAWADESNDEPLTAFMSAIETALSPYTRPDTKLREKIALAKRAALPAIGRVVTSAAGKASQRYFGDHIFDDLGELFDPADVSSGDAKDGNAIADGFDAGMAAITKEIASVVDRQGAERLADYRRQRKSRHVFSRNMQALVCEIERSSSDGQPPLFVVVDELDRCRPDYAIKMLEEIKHFFEIQGVVFVFALHGDQLTKSVNAIYGAEFDSKAYLRRFFNRTYRLRRLSLDELVRTHFESCSFSHQVFSYPPLRNGSVPGWQVDAATFSARLLSDFSLTPREVQAVIDGLEIFAGQWSVKVPIELPYILFLLVALVRGESIPETLRSALATQLYTLPSSRFHEKVDNVTTDKLLNAYVALSKRSFTDLYNKTWGDPAQGYVANRMDHEYAVLHGRSSPGGHPVPSVLLRYEQALQQISGLIPEANGDLPA